MTKYLIPLSDGKWSGFWDDEVGAPPPPEAISISQEVFDILMSDSSMLYVDGSAVEAPPPPPTIPAKISRFQARAILLQRGLLASVEAAVAAADPMTQLAWAETIEWQRDSPTLETLAVGVLGMTPEQLDEMFIEAAQIRA